MKAVAKHYMIRLDITGDKKIQTTLCLRITEYQFGH